MSDSEIRVDQTPTRALVTGGAGFIGSHLTESLLEREYQVTILDDLSTGRLANVAHLVNHRDVRVVEDTIGNDELLDQLVDDCDVIYHLAAAVGVELILRDPIGVFETNVLGTHALLRTANRHGKKVVMTSTSEIYGKSNRIPFREDDDRVLGPTTKSRWSYSTSKAVDEFLALAYHRQAGLPVVIARLFNTVGPRQSGQYGMVVPRLVQQALRGEALTVYGDGQQSRCFCDVGDVVRALIGLAECPQAIGQVFNVGSTTEVSILELARKILALTDSGEAASNQQSSISAPATNGERISFIPYEKAYEPGFEDTRQRLPDITRISTAIGWRPRVSLDETLRRVIFFYRSAGD